MGNLFRFKKINIIFIIQISFYSHIGYGWTQQKINKYGLITDGYGIVGEDDLVYDIKYRIIDPYNPSKSTFGIYWQCLPVADVKPSYRTWRGNDGMGLADVIVTMCDLSISFRRNGELHRFCDRRAHEISYCKDFMKTWKELTSNEKIVCLNGDSPLYYHRKEYGKYILWTWNKFKTKKGCYSYFAGDCDVAGAANKYSKTSQEK